MNYRDCLKKGIDVLKNEGIEEAALDARLLLEHVCHTDRNYLLVYGDSEVTKDQEAEYLRMIGLRSRRIPLQYITGVQNFMGLDFSVNEQVLIPRQDTEILVEEVLRQIADGSRILDMCTGSGCILISLLHYSNWCEGVGADISEAALKVAMQNAENLLQKKIPTSSWKFIKSDLFENIEGSFDIIVSNPPYICSEVIETLMPEVRIHEPRQALDGMADGLYFYRRIVLESKQYLKYGGMLYFEIGYDQGTAVSDLMKNAGFAEVRIVKDYAGLDRVVYGRWNKREVDHV